MPDLKPLALPANIIYTYDGSFDGFLCCVFESVYGAELPYDIIRQGDLPATLLAMRPVRTDPLRAEREIGRAHV